IRQNLGGPGVSDEELILRYIMKGENEINAMRAAGPARQYYTSAMPLLTLLQELDKRHSVRYIHVQRGGDSVLLQRAASASASHRSSAPSKASPATV
ncbi:MAG: hypothetical protein KGJ86_08840, partial [Chloroflexota bacterium]|nr:hypothetical protein [Chloroflexota bacterium]